MGPDAARDTLIGIVLMGSATMMFACLDAQAKYLSQELPVLQVAWGRYFVNFVVVALVFLPRRGLRLLRTYRLGLQLGRSVLLVCCTVLFFLAISQMPLADAIALGFVSPLLVTALSVPLLGEQVGARRWTAVAIGFVGAMIIVRPGLGVMHWAAGLVLLMAVFYALYQIFTRKLGVTEDPWTTLFYSAMVGAAALTAAMPFVWVTPPTLWHAMMLADLGIFGGFGHYLLILAFRRAPAAVLAPLTYLSLPWGVVTGYLVFGDFPDAWTFAGSGVLIATGLYILYREGVRRRVESD